MDSFIIESNNKTVRVNDIEIVFNFDDSKFCKKITDFKLNMDSAIEELQEEKTTSHEEFCQALSDAFNDVFGEGKIKEIFKTELPNAFMLLKLFEFIVPYIAEFVVDRENEINEKYNPKRMGESAG